jgi:signal transduction histidine kinase
MRRRLLLSTLAVAVGAVLLLGVPLAVVVSRLELQEAAQQLERDATTAAQGLQYRLDSGRPTDVWELAKSLPDRYLIIRQQGRPTITIGRPPPAGHVRESRLATDSFDVTVETDSAIADAVVVDSLLLIGGLSVAAVGVAVGLAFLQARRFTLPLVELAQAAGRLGSGDSRPLGRRYGMPELDQVADGLDRSAARVADLISAGREFAADASHQLRTPLTALSMRLEEILAAAANPDAVSEEATAALVQTERLADVVGQLLDRTRPDRPGGAEQVGIDDIVAQQVAEWEPAFRRADRKLEVAGTKGLRAEVTPGGLAQVIATLLDNALTHGAGAVTIRTSQTPKSVVTEIRDEGAGVPSELVSRIFERNVSGSGGSGRGLALARAIAAADGGRVVLVRPRPAVFAIFLPRKTPAGETIAPAVAGPG